MGEALDMIHSGAKLLSICEPMKIEHKLSAQRTQWWDGHRIIFIDVPIQSWGKWKAKEFTSSKQI